VILIDPKKSMKTLEAVAYEKWFGGLMIGIWIGLFLIQYLVEYLLQ